MSVQEIVRSLAGITVRCCIALILALSLVAPVLAQEYIGPADDAFYPQEEDDKSVLTVPSAPTEKTGGGGSGDTVFIETVDPALFPQICTYVTVTHNGSTVPGLDPDSFCVRQDGIVIDSFTAVQQTLDSCITKICLVIDRSGSMAGTKLTAAKNAALALMRQMDQYDQMAIVSFSDCYTVNRNFTSDTNLIKTAINGLTANGRTAAFDGTWAGVDITKLLTGSKAVIALTDGLENESGDCSAPPDGLGDGAGFTDDSTLIVNFAKTSSVPIYSITLGSDFNVRYMKGLALGSGGGYYHAPTGDQLEDIYLAIKERLCRRYLICYTSPDTIQDGTCHTLVICRDNADGDKTGTPDCYVCDTTVFCEPNPPVITIEVDPACRRWGQPVELCATVTDTDTPADELLVKLFYRIYEPGGPFLEVTPTRNGNVFCHTIPAGFVPCGKDSIEFYFTASDSITSVASPYDAPASSHQVTICQNTPPTCEFGPDLAPPVCNPSSPIDFVPLNLTDIDNNKVDCYLWGDGQLVPGGWQNDNAIPGDTAKAWITCIDSCGDSCNLYIERFYPERELIPCNIPDGGDTAFFLCDPGLLSIPVSGGPGSGCTLLSGAGELINGEWRWNATKDTVITFVVQCVSVCDSCQSTYTVSIDVNEPPICGEGRIDPNPKGGELCDSVNLSDHFTLTFKSVSYDGNNSTWCYELVWDGVTPGLSHLTLELCDDLTQANFVSSSPAGAEIELDGSTGLYGIKWDSNDLPAIPANTPVQFCFTINQPLALAQASFVPKAGQNDDIVEICGPSTSCEERDPDENPTPCDTTVFLCDPGEVCVPFKSSDPDNNLDLCRIVSGPGALVNGSWCFDATESGTYFVTIECIDSCGASCQQTLCATVVIDEVPVVTCPPDTSFECDEVGDYGTATFVDGGFSPSTLEVFKDSVPGNCAGTYTLRIKYVASDTCGHRDSCFQSVSVGDTTAPVITCPDTLWVECDETVPLDSLPKPTVTDNCDDSVALARTAASSTASPCVDSSYMTIQWIATDDCGNADTCVQVVITIDTTAPTLDKCDTLFVFECYPGSKDASSISPFLPTATDNCDPDPEVGYVFLPSSGTYPCDYLYRVAIFATDRCGNVSDTCYQTIQIIDTTKPVINCPVDTVVINCPNQIILVPPSATDNCGAPVDVVAVGDTIVDSTCLGSYLRIVAWEAKDQCGNVDTCLQYIRHQDTTAPVIECAAGTSVACNDTIIATAPQATDQCDPAPTVREIGRRVVDSVSACNYVVVVAWEAMDDCGNADTCESRYVIYDNVPPIIVCPPDTTYDCHLVPDTSLWPKPTATDSCDEFVVPYLIGFDSTFGQCLEDRIFALLWIATDDCGNSVECTQYVYVRDTTKPIVECPNDTVIACQDIPPAALADLKSVPIGQYPFGTPTATDNCDNSLTVDWKVWADSGVFPCDKRFIIAYWTIDDCNNLSDTCFQRVQIVDTIAPVIVCPDPDTVLCTEIPTFYVAPPATDNCDAQVTVTQLGEPRWGYADCPTPDTIVVTWVAVDNCDNTDTCFQYIHVIDSTPPVLICDDVRYECDSIPTEWTKPGATDLCDPAPVVTLLSNSDTTLGDCPQRYSFILTWEAMDECGNADTCEQTVYIYDETAPEVTCPNDTIIACQDIPPTLLGASAVATSSSKVPVGPFPFGTPLAKDNCDPSPEIYWFIADQGGTFPCNKTFVIGYWSTDSCGNASDTCFQDVSIVDTLDPVVTCPPDTTLDCILATKVSDLVIGQDMKGVGTAWPYGEPSATDNCDPSPFVYGPIFVGIASSDSCQYVLRMQYIATDDCQNADTCEQLVTIIDTIAPVFKCPDSLVFQCTNNTCKAALDAGDFKAALDCASATAAIAFDVTDQCDPTPTVDIVRIDTLSEFCPFAYQLVLVARDSCGNRSDTCFWKWVFEDTTAPRIDCPAPRRISCDSLWDGIFASDTLGWPSAIDECDQSPEVAFAGYTKIGDGCTYIIRRAFVATDTCGNESDTCFQDITVYDETAPTIVCPADTLVDCTEMARYNENNPKLALERIADGSTSKDAQGCYDYDWAFGTPTATDDCSGILSYCLMNVSRDPGACSTTFTLIFTATDSCGNISDTCSQRVIFTDTTAPVVDCADDTTVYCSTVPPCFDGKSSGKSGEKFLCDFRLIDTVYDACDEFIEYDYELSYHFEQCPRYVRAKIWAVDDCGNISDTCLWTVYFDDTVAPVIACPQDINAECGTNPGDWGTATATDDCGQPTVTLIDVDTIAQNSCYLEVTRTWTATDFCGNADTCTQLIVIGDSTAPVLTCPNDTVVSCEDPLAREGRAILDGWLPLPPKGRVQGQCELDYNFLFGMPTATDNCTSEPHICLIDVKLKESTTCSFNYVLVFEAVDECGNADTCEQSVTFVDDEGPTLVCATDTTIYCDDDKAACIQLKGTEPFELKGDDKFLCGFRIVDTVYDGCCEDVTLYSRLTYHLNQCPAYIRVFVWAKDCCGNYSDTCRWILNIADTAAPVITCPQDLTFECNEAQGDWGWPTATDNCDDNVVVTLFDQDTLTEGCETRITRTFSAKDRCDQESRCQQVITISDTTDPVCNVPNDTTIFICAPGQQVCLPVSATDNCDQAVECVVADGAGDIANGMWCYTPTESGPVTAYIRCSDDCGNACSDNFTVTFVINEAPVCHLPNDTTIYLCDPAQVVLNGFTFDPNGNLAVCSIRVHQPEVKSTQSTDADTGKVQITIDVTEDFYACIAIACYDSCGEVCYDSFCVTIDITEIQECYQTPDTTVTLCDPQEICILYDWLDPVKGSTSSDVVQAPRGGKGKYSTPQRVPLNQPVANPGIKTIYEECIIAQGPGVLKGDYWCWTPPDHDTTVTVRIICGDTCFHTCTNEFTVTFDMDLNPVCSLLVELVDPICTPETDFVPYLSYDPDGTTECYLVGDGELVQGGWQLQNPEPGTSANVKIICKDACDSCIIEFTRNYPERIPVECRVPDAIDTVLCQPTTLSFPVGSTEGAECRVVSGPGSIDANSWFYYAERDTSFCVTIECKSLCDSCTAEFCVTIDMNDPPVCELPNDTTIFLCEAGTVCLPIGATDVNGNFSHCEIDYGPGGKSIDYGYIQNGLWCFDVTVSDEITVPIICYDSCGASCSGNFTVTFEVNDAPACQVIADTSVFLCEPTKICIPFETKNEEGQSVTCQVVSGDAFYENGFICLTPQSAGVYNITVRCTDSCGATCEESFAVTVDFNEAPVCNGPTGDTTIFLCMPSEVCISWGATDPNGNLLECIIVDDDGKGTPTGGGVTWCDFISVPFSKDFVIRCSDSCGATCERTLTVHFTFNNPPVINLGDDIASLVGDGQVCFNYTVSDPQGMAGLEENLWEAPAGAVIDTAANTICWTPEEAGFFTFVGRVNDPCNANDFDTAFVLVAQPAPPICNIPSDTTITLCNLQQINLPVSATSQNPPVNCVVTAGYGSVSGGFWRFTPESEGVYDVTITCTDAQGGQCNGSFQVTVLLNQAPICNVRDTSIFICDVGTQLCIPVSGTDPEGGAVTCTKISGPGTLSNGNWCYTANSDASFSVTFRCTDPCGLYCEKTVNININMNEAPQCNIPFNQTVIICRGDQVCLNLSAIDLDGNLDTCGIKDGLGEVLPNGPNGQYRWCYTPSNPGLIPVTIFCADECGDTCFTPRQYTVLFKPTSECTGQSGQVIIIGPAAVMNAGDINGSGDVNVADLALLTAIVHQQNLRGKTASFDVSAAAAGYQYRADVNCDGTVDRADIAFLTQYIFNSGPEPCEPGTE